MLRVLTQALVVIGAPVRPHDLPSHKLELGESPEYPSVAGVAAAILACGFLRCFEFVIA